MYDPDAPDPLAPWVREITASHNQARHTEGVQCRGSVALIDEAARLRGAAEVKLGKAISLEREIETREAQVEKLREIMSTERDLWIQMGLPELAEGHGGVDLDVRIGVRGRGAHGGDVIKYDAHGVWMTHMDGLAHIGADASWHGPIPAENSNTDEDTMVNWAQHGIATRGVLLDIPAVRGVEWVTADNPVTAEDLDAALLAAGTEILPGDAILVYQGRDRFEAAGNYYPSGATQGPRPGIGESGAKWIASKDPGLLLWDFHDARSDVGFSLEVHSLIWAIGLCIVDNSLLGPAAAELKRAGRSTGQLIAAPTAIHRSTGVIINPLLVY